MKAHLFIETGEVRAPRVLDWLQNNIGDFVLADQDYPFKAPILTHHEIEIPDGATKLDIFPDWHGRDIWSPIIALKSIPIPRKKTVKKWIWETTIEHDKYAEAGDTRKVVVWRTSVHLSEEEMRKWHDFNRFHYHPIDETMIEVDAE
jgi:hypothetical protein